MSLKRRDSLDEFLIFQSEIPTEEAQSERQRLTNEGVNFGKLDSVFNEMMAQKVSIPPWLSAAQSTKKKLDAVFERNRVKIQDRFENAHDLIAAVKAGKMGKHMQQQITAHFRNRDTASMSDADIRRILQDCDMLIFLNEKKDQDE